MPPRPVNPLYHQSLAFRTVSCRIVFFSGPPHSHVEGSIFDRRVLRSRFGKRRVLSLGSRGFQGLYLRNNPLLASHARTLVRLISNQDFYIQAFSIDESDYLEWEEGDLGLTGRCSVTLTSALERNKRLEVETHQAAVRLLALSRTVFFGSPAPTFSSTKLTKRSHHSRLLDLLFELLQVILSFVYPCALSKRQIRSVLRHAADRTTLPPRISELPQSYMLLLGRAARRTARRTARRRLSSIKRDKFLKETGCDRYEW